MTPDDFVTEFGRVRVSAILRTDDQRKAAEAMDAALRGGFTALRDCGGKDYLEFGVRDAIARGVFPGPTIKASGRIICMTGGHGNRIGRVADGPRGHGGGRPG